MQTFMLHAQATFIHNTPTPYSSTHLFRSNSKLFTHGLFHMTTKITATTITTATNRTATKCLMPKHKLLKLCSEQNEQWKNAKVKSEERARWYAANVAELNGEPPFWRTCLLPSHVALTHANTDTLTHTQIAKFMYVNHENKSNNNGNNNCSHSVIYW